MGRASLAAGNPARAIENFQLYLKDYPGGADRFAVRFQLGEAQQKANQLLPARLTWTDLARDIERLKPAELTKELAAIRADALYEIASTYRHPQSARRHQPEPGRRGPAAVPRGFPGPSQGRPRGLSSRRVVPGPRQEHRSTRGLHAVPQGGDGFRSRPTKPAATGPSSRWTPRSRSARSFRASRSSPRRSPPGRATWPGSPTARRAPTPSARSSTPSS